jgi:5-formyltetrahydrofolate cyclo-ligase
MSKRDPVRTLREQKRLSFYDFQRFGKEQQARKQNRTKQIQKTSARNILVLFCLQNEQRRQKIPFVRRKQ